MSLCRIAALLSVMAMPLRGRLENRSTNDTHLCRCRLLACVWSFLVGWWRQIAQHPLNRCPIDPGGAILDQMLNILTQASAAVDPRNRTLDHPTARLDLKANLIGHAPNNLDRDTEHLGGPFAKVATVTLVSPGIGHTWTQLLCLGERWLHPIPILDVGGVDYYRQQIAFRIDDELPFAPINLFAAIKAALAAGFGGFDRLAVHDDGGRFTLTPLLKTHGTAQAIVDFEHGAVVVPFVEIVANGPRWWEVARNVAPLTAGAVLIHQSVNHAPQADGSTPTTAFPWPGKRVLSKPTARRLSRSSIPSYHLGSRIRMHKPIMVSRRC